MVLRKREGQGLSKLKGIEPHHAHGWQWLLYATMWQEHKPQHQVVKVRFHDRYLLKRRLSQRRVFFDRVAFALVCEFFRSEFLTDCMCAIITEAVKGLNLHELRVCFLVRD